MQRYSETSFVHLQGDEVIQAKIYGSHGKFLPVFIYSPNQVSQLFVGTTTDISYKLGLV